MPRTQLWLVNDSFYFADAFLLFVFVCFFYRATSWKGREEGAICSVLCLVYLHVSIGGTGSEQKQILWFRCVSEHWTTTGRMCTDPQCKQSLCNGGSWTHSNCSRSNIVISLTPILKYSLRSSNWIWVNNYHVQEFWFHSLPLFLQCTDLGMVWLIKAFDNVAFVNDIFK